MKNRKQLADDIGDAICESVERISLDGRISLLEKQNAELLAAMKKIVAIKDRVAMRSTTFKFEALAEISKLAEDTIRSVSEAQWAIK